MDDTHPIIRDEFNRRLMNLTGETRMLMGSRMFDACREMVLASLPKHLTDSEVKEALFLRFYGDEFDDIQCATLLEYIRSGG